MTIFEDYVIIEYCYDRCKVAVSVTGREDIRMKIKSWIKIAVVAVLIVLVACLALNGIQIGKYIVTPVGDAISLGLDLQGGISTVYVAKDSSVENFDSLMESTISVLRTRLTNAGYTEATVARQGSDAIRVEIPDVDDPQQVVDIIGKPAHLEFRDPNGNVILEGANIESCGVGYDETTGQAYVGFQLDAEGTKAFADATSEFMGKTIAIYLDGEVISSPTVQSVIPNSQGSITMGNLSAEESQKQSQELALLIQSGALPLDIEESETRAISATLGFEAIDGAVIAGIVGLCLVVLFMIIMYRLPGVAASMALSIYVLIVFYALAIFNAQLTLQGIAGILLGIGMAVDANVIIFERFREEYKLGRTLNNAVKFGFKNAFSSIIDSNVTTVIAAVVLLIFGTGSIKGFASTLIISVVVSFFTATFITRWLLKSFVNLGFTKKWLYTR